MFAGKKVLAVGAHPDDVELGCGGTIARAAIGGARVTVVTVVNEGPKAVRVAAKVQRAEALLALLGEPFDATVPLHCLTGFEGRRVHEVRQGLLDELLRLKGLYKPDVVFVHAEGDSHQDHEVVAREATRAFRDVPLVLRYGCPWNTPERNNVYVELSQTELGRKMRAVECYASVFEKSHLPVPPYLCSDAVKSRAQMAAVAARFGVVESAIAGRTVSFAEGFELSHLRL